MKKTLLIFALAGLALNGSAQTEQGRIMVGAGVNFGSTTDEEFDVTDGKVVERIKNNTLNWNLRGGYFLADNFMLGLTFGMGSSTTKTEFINTAATSTKTDKNNNTQFGVFIRKYKMLGSSRFGIFGQAGLNYGMGTNSSETDNPPTPTTKSSGDNNFTTIQVHPGITYFLTDMIAFETYFGNVGLEMRSEKKYDNDGKQTTGSNSTNFRTGLNLNLSTIWVGMNFYFGGSGGSDTKPATNP